jgi:hypothetical protein
MRMLSFIQWAVISAPDRLVFWRLAPARFGPLSVTRRLGREQLPPSDGPLLNPVGIIERKGDQRKHNASGLKAAGEPVERRKCSP